MAKGINFLKGKKSQDYLFETAVKKIRVICFAILAAYLVLGGGLIVFWFSLNSQINKTAQLTEAKKQQITQLKPVEYSLLTLKQRLEFFEKVSNGQTIEFIPALETLFALEKDGVSFDGVTISDTGNTVISGKASQSLSLAAFVKNLESKDKMIKKAALKSLSREQSGGYQIEIEMILNTQ